MRKLRRKYYKRLAFINRQKKVDAEFWAFIFEHQEELGISDWNPVR